MTNKSRIASVLFKYIVFLVKKGIDHILSTST